MVILGAWAWGQGPVDGCQTFANPPPPGVPVRGLVARKVPPGGDPTAGFARPPPPRNKFRPAPPSGPPPPGAYVMQRKPFDAATALDLPAPPEPFARPPPGRLQFVMLTRFFRSAEGLIPLRRGVVTCSQIIYVNEIRI